MTLLISVPAMLGLVLLAEPLIATLFQYRQFTAFDTRMTALSVYGLSFGLPAFALLKVVCRPSTPARTPRPRCAAWPRWWPTWCSTSPCWPCCTR